LSFVEKVNNIINGGVSKILGFSSVFTEARLENQNVFFLSKVMGFEVRILSPI